MTKDSQQGKQSQGRTWEEWAREGLPEYIAERFGIDEIDTKAFATNLVNEGSEIVASFFKQSETTRKKPAEQSEIDLKYEEIYEYNGEEFKSSDKPYKEKSSKTQSLENKENFKLKKDFLTKTKDLIDENDREYKYGDIYKSQEDIQVLENPLSIKSDKEFLKLDKERQTVVIEKTLENPDQGKKLINHIMKDEELVKRLLGDLLKAHEARMPLMIEDAPARIPQTVKLGKVPQSIELEGREDLKSRKMPLMIKNEPENKEQVAVSAGTKGKKELNIDTALLETAGERRISPTSVAQSFSRPETPVNNVKHEVQEATQNVSVKDRTKAFQGNGGVNPKATVQTTEGKRFGVRGPVPARPQGRGLTNEEQQMISENVDTIKPGSVASLRGKFDRKGQGRQ